ncbi:MAG TPA: glycosyltransferase family 39 protein [Mycobacteriales bacterium]|nr:glycosyltransferase family 39 protein [Mycobacteriales bacterium]
MSIDVPPPPTLTVPLPRPARTGVLADRHTPRPRRETRFDRWMARAMTSQIIWLAPVLVTQAWFAFRLNNSLEQDEALYVTAGHQLIAHILHGTRAPDFGSYFSGVPAAYAIPAAVLDHLGGVMLVHATNTVIGLTASVFVYLATRRLFGHGAALVAAAVFGLNPATLFVSRFASFDAPSLLLLAVALYLAVRVSDGRRYAIALGPCLTLAAAEKYFALAFVPSVIIIAFLAAAKRTDPASAMRRVALAIGSLVVCCGIGALMLDPADWQGMRSTSLDRTTLLPEGRLTLLRDCTHYIGALALAGAIGVLLVRRRRAVLGVVLLATSLIPPVVQIRFSESASLHKNMAFGVLFLAPLVGVTGMALLRRGRYLGVRAATALVCAVLLLSSGVGTSQAMVNGWPNSNRIMLVLAHYVRPGTQKYLVDDSMIPAYYLSGLTSYRQWESTYDVQFEGPHGAQVMQDQLANGKYALFLYRDDGATIALDRQMLTILRSRYTLVAKVPFSTAGGNHYWYLWRAELPR